MMHMITKPFLNELDDLMQNITIISETSYTFRNQFYNIVNDIHENKVGRKVLAELFISHLKDTLYQIYHCRQNINDDNISPYEINSDYQNIFDNRDFIESLSKANAGHGSWEPGWKIQKLEKSGQIRVYKDGLTLWVIPSQFIPFSGSTEIGKQGYIYMVKEFRALLPGFYMALGNAPINDEPITVRIYWNVESSGAISLMKYITTELNKINVPFKFKIVNNPNFYSRADAGVLYINKKYIKNAKDSLLAIYPKIRAHLKNSTPFFAKTIGPGISIAEDPNNGESFGQHRSRIVAESLYSIYKNNISSLEEKIAKVAIQFNKSGLDFNHPYLSSGSSDNDYDINMGIPEYNESR